MSTQFEYWREYFESRFAAESMDTVRRLDYSNELVRQQTYACLLDGLGVVNGQTVLDAGCGNGEFARLCDCLGGRVTGLDMNRVAIGKLRARHTGIEWIAAPLGDAAFLAARLGRIQCVVCAEVLQYVDTAEIVPWLWQLVAPGGRLVLMGPNHDCPIIRGVEQRYEDKFKAWTIGQWRQCFRSLADVEAVWLRLLAFGNDQRLRPYEVGGWFEPSGDLVPDGSIPNRLEWVLQKKPRHSAE